jgi:type IV pilus assembly protein PilP
MRATIVATLLAGALASACSDAAKPAPSQATPPPPVVRTAADAGAPTVQKRVDLSESDFVESERNRDPFRPFVNIAKGTVNPPPNQRAVKLRNTSIAEPALMAIVLGGEGARAMFVDARGKGHVLHPGDYFGRPESVRVGATGPEYQVNWRVDRIREGDVVLLREDPAQPQVAAVTRVIPLRPEGDKVEPLD